MEIKLSVSAFKPKVQTGDPKRDLATSPSGRQTKGAMSAADVTKVAMSLLPALKKKLQAKVSDRVLKVAVVTAAENWAATTRSNEFPEAARHKAVSRVATQLEKLYKRKEPAGFSSPDNTKAKGRKMTKAEITEVAERLVYEVKFRGKVDSKPKDDAINRIIGSWTGKHSAKLPNATRLLNQSLVSKKLVELVNKAADTKGEKAPVKAPADKVVPTTKAATKEEKQKAQILAATKLRNQFQGMLTKVPAMTGKSIENIRKHCDAYNRVITSVQKGNEALAETTKIEGLRGIDSVKNYVNNVLGLTYGYVEFAKVMAGTQADFKDRVMNRLKPEEMTKVELRRKAKENAQFALMNFTKQLGKRQCRVPQKFNTDMQRIFSTAAESGDFKTAKAEARALFDTLVADVFSNKVKMYSAK